MTILTHKEFRELLKKKGIVIKDITSRSVHVEEINGKPYHPVKGFISPDYSPSEIYQLYMMYKDAGWTRMNKFFFDRSKEGSTTSALKAAGELRTRHQHTDRRGALAYEDADQLKLFLQELQKKYVKSYTSLYKMMYWVPLKDVPLYINHYWLGIPAKWRLELGK